MNRKVLALLVLIIVGACLVMGCAGRKNEAAPTPTLKPTVLATATAQASTQPTATPAPASATVSPSSSASVAGGASAVAGLDPSLLDTTGEGQDEGGMPDTGLPTPSID